MPEMSIGVHTVGINSGKVSEVQPYRPLEELTVEISQWDVTVRLRNSISGFEALL